MTPDDMRAKAEELRTEALQLADLSDDEEDLECVFSIHAMRQRASTWSVGAEICERLDRANDRAEEEATARRELGG